MAWIVVKLFNGTQLSVNLDHVVSIEPVPTGNTGNGARLRTTIQDEKGNPLVYVVQEPWSVIAGAAERS
jgi:hypothetical protein